MLRVRSHWITKLSVLLLLVVVATPISPAWAHGGGTVRAEWETNQFHMVIETNEDLSAGTLGGVVHVTLIPTPPGGGTTRLRGLHIEVTGRGPEGAVAGPIRAKQYLDGAYEADLMVNQPGDWTFEIRVGEENNVQTFEFTLPVYGRAWWSDLWVVGGLLMIPVLGLFGMVRIARKNTATTDDTEGV